MPQIEYAVLPLDQKPQGQGWLIWGGNHLTNSWWRVVIKEGDKPSAYFQGGFLIHP